MNLPALLPEAILAVGLVGALLVDTREAARRRGDSLWLGLLASALAAVAAAGAPLEPDGAMLAFDRTALLARPAIALLTALVLLATIGQRQSTPIGRTAARDHGAWTVCVLGIGLGALLLSAAANLLALWFGLELVSLGSYALAAWRNGNRPGDGRRAAEAGMKFVLFGGAATGAMLFGSSHVYGLTGHFDFAGIGREIAVGLPLPAYAALLLAATGAAFKLTLVPFHFYAPDVYQGAPPLGIAAATAAPKLAVGAVLVRALGAMLPAAPDHPAAVPPQLATGLAVAAIASMLVAALLAVVQRNAKRIVACSGIGHGGTLLLALAGAPTPLATATVLHYLLAYAVANTGALVCLDAIERRHGSSDLQALAGAGAERPWLTAALCLCLFSLAGVPPLAGFVAKWAVLQQALGHGSGALVVAAFALLLATAIAAWAYLLIVRAVALAPADAAAIAARGPLARLPWPTALAIGACVAATVLLGGWLDVVPTVMRALRP